MQRIPTPETNCYACGKPIKGFACEAVLIDDDGATVHVGPNCYHKINRAGSLGFTSRKCPVRLFANIYQRKAYLAVNP